MTRNIADEWAANLTKVRLLRVRIWDRFGAEIAEFDTLLTSSTSFGEARPADELSLARMSRSDQLAQNNPAPSYTTQYRPAPRRDSPRSTPI